MNAKGMIASLDGLRKKIKAASNVQIFSTTLKGEMAALTAEYFTSFRPAAVGAGAPAEELAEADRLFKSLHELSHKNPSKTKCDGVCKDARKALVALEGGRLQSSGVTPGVRISKSDELIVSSLKEVCPSAAAAYEQALHDLQGSERLSWRGPATDMREALRETLDALAPDAEVENMSGYRPEPDTRRPSMRQKAKYILKSREMVSNQIALSETAITHIEDAVSGITRSVYVRSNISTHTPTSRDEVARLHGWVRLVMCDLLSLPIVD
jgi:hypothetical protein